MARVTSAVDDGQDDQLVCMHLEKYRVWEAPKNRPARLASNTREGQRRVEDLFDGTLDRSHERGSESWLSFVIPGARFE